MTEFTRRRFVKGAAIAPLAVKHLAMQQAAGITDRYDIVVAGAGHNSLISAAYLAKAGYRCLVLEGRPKIGGGVKTAELTLKGFHDDCCSTAHVFIQDNPLIKNDELSLLKQQAQLGKGVGRYQIHREGWRTWRLDTATGQICILLTSDSDWKKPEIAMRGCSLN